MENKSYKEKCLEQFEEQFKDSFTYGAMETWEDGLAVKDFISKALKGQVKEVTDLIASQVGFLKMRGQDYSQLQELYENLKQAGLI